MNILEKADHTSQLIPGYQYLYSGEADNHLIHHLLDKKYGRNAMNIDEVETACFSGMHADHIYFTQHNKNQNQIERCFGKCRIVTDSLEEMQEIDKIAGNHLASSHLAVIGIKVIPDAYDDGNQYGFKACELASLAAKFKKLQHLSVRGCFIEGNLSSFQGTELGRHFRLCYETAKLVTTAIPCGISYVSIGACTEAVWQNSVEQKESFQDVCRIAEIVRYQNDTAFYAKLLML